MGKLLIAVVHQADAQAVADALRAEGYRFTKIPSIGGFLGEPNATYVLAVEDEREQAALSVFEKTVRPREIEVPLVLLERLSDWKQRTVSHGGATILVADLERIIRV